MSIVEDYLAREVAAVAQRYPSLSAEGINPRWRDAVTAHHAARARMIAAPFLIEVLQLQGWLSAYGRCLPDSTTSAAIHQIHDGGGCIPEAGARIVAAVLAGYVPVMPAANTLPHCYLHREIDSGVRTCWMPTVASDGQALASLKRLGWARPARAARSIEA